ncbi:MAG: hypothetical protein A3H98_08290 [Bacteroidetes bacterium RIFCSPLOWO2_02_FULL_36_8]|nr:MAG: hypothetical protein A3H98_08290 [Bacteroidetes bacterium RIFCSPLOWO2_02_FULL_36_8]OFY68897.1 MAG: hypothetical protein A3G23_03705 [Bacteroidetes bacterium RIFCSPLOWO2_12_FULL_37_12]
MKTTQDRKEIQNKLKIILNNYVNQLLKGGSKKVKKAVKKASKIVAKAIVRNVEDSDGQVSMQKNIDINKSHLVTTKPTGKKPVKKNHANKKTVKPVQKVNKPIVTGKKQKKSSVRKITAKKDVSSIKKPIATVPVTSVVNI